MTFNPWSQVPGDGRDDDDQKKPPSYPHQNPTFEDLLEQSNESIDPSLVGQGVDPFTYDPNHIYTATPQQPSGSGSNQQQGQFGITNQGVNSEYWSQPPQPPVNTGLPTAPLAPGGILNNSNQYLNHGRYIPNQSSGYTAPFNMPSSTSSTGQNENQTHRNKRIKTSNESGYGGTPAQDRPNRLNDVTALYPAPRYPPGATPLPGYDEMQATNRDSIRPQPRASDRPPLREVPSGTNGLDDTTTPQDLGLGILNERLAQRDPNNVHFINTSSDIIFESLEERDEFSNFQKRRRRDLGIEGDFHAPSYRGRVTNGRLVDGNGDKSSAARKQTREARAKKSRKSSGSKQPPKKGKGRANLPRRSMPAKGKKSTSKANGEEKQPSKKHPMPQFKGFPTFKRGAPPLTKEQLGDMTLYDIAQRYPNHLNGEGLDPFIQRYWSAKEIYNAMARSAQEEVEERNKDAPPGNSLEMFLVKRRQARINALRKGNLWNDLIRPATHKPPQFDRGDGRPDSLVRYSSEKKVWRKKNFTRAKGEPVEDSSESEDDHYGDGNDGGDGEFDDENDDEFDGDADLDGDMDVNDDGDGNGVDGNADDDDDDAPGEEDWDAEA